MEQKAFNLDSSVFNFDSMITPKIITFVYVLGLVLIVLASLASFLGGSFVPGAALLVFGLIGFRIWCELLIVLFKINENIQKIADRSA